MKKTIAIIITILALSLTACSSGENNGPAKLGSGQETIETTDKAREGTEAGQAADRFAVVHNGTKIVINTDAAPVIKALGEPENYFESESCAYQGMDKTYDYTIFKLYTYPDGDKDLISSVEFTSDVMETTEGIKIGTAEAEVDSVYGSNYKANGMARIYNSGDTNLSIVIKDGKVSGIIYNYKELKN